MAPLRVVATSLLVAGLAAVPACKDKTEDDGETATADTLASTSGMTLPVVGAPVRKGDLVLTVTTTGQVRSDAVATIRSETQGPITEVLARPGQRVAKGDPLVQVDPRLLDIAVHQAEAQLEKARLNVLDNTVPDSIVTGRAVTGVRLRNAEIRAGIDESRAALEKAKFDREKATITAPFDGTIDEIRVAVGSRLSQGDEIGTIVDLSNLRVEAQVLEHDLPYVKTGGEAFVTPATPDQAVHGRISAILPLVDSATRAGRAVIRAPGNGCSAPGCTPTPSRGHPASQPDHRSGPRRDRAGRPAAGLRREGGPGPVGLHRPRAQQRRRDRSASRFIHRPDPGWPWGHGAHRGSPDPDARCAGPGLRAEP